MSQPSATLTTPLQRASALLAQGRADKALVLTKPLVRAPGAEHAALVAHASALKALGRGAEAFGFSERAARDYPSSAVAWHNLAAGLGDLGRPGEAVQAAQRAFAVGGDAPETWLVLARAHRALDDFDAAERAYAEALRRRPAYPDAALELARLLWMRTGEVARAAAPLRAAMAAGAPPGLLAPAEADMLKIAGREGERQALFDAALSALPSDGPLLLAASQARLEAGRTAEAAALADRALALHPEEPALLLQIASTRIATGRPREALAAARRAAALRPLDQGAWGWVATAARAAGDPQAGVLNDYAGLVRAWRLPTPEGWPDLPAFLRDLAPALRAQHRFKAEPAEQSLRGGTQTGADLSRSADPVIAAFFRAVDTPIRQHLAALGRERDPVRSRNTGRYRFDGAWSVQLRQGGSHADHFHSAGWLSSAFYVDLPRAIESDDRQGWIRFGQPPTVAVPPLPAEHHVRPEPGMLVLFPSYMWHGTVPFASDETRLTIAFDLVPA